MTAPQADMRNPWLKKNPFLSLWLSAANSAAGLARGQAAASVKRQSNAVVAQANQAVVDFWAGALTGTAAKPRARSKAKRQAQRQEIAMNQSVIDVHNGIRFQVEAVPHGDLFEGRFTVLEPGGAERGSDDSYRPTLDNSWATEQEALNYATEAAHHAIEGIPPFNGRARGAT